MSAGAGEYCGGHLAAQLVIIIIIIIIIIIGAGSLVVEVATAIAGQAQQ